MKFHIKKIRLWPKNQSEPRILEFENNKVNVITGEKSKGKSSILSIIDYCLLSTDSRIVEEVINETVDWYGLEFRINDLDYVIIRRHPNKRIGSKEIYFSSVGELPETISANNDIKKVKSILEHQFGIDESIVIPYGGKKIRIGSKVSFRYFFLFNTLSENIIANENIFFDLDLYDREQYKEALDRIFYLALGADDLNAVLIKEQITNYEIELDKIEKKKKALTKDERLFNEQIIHLTSQAQEYGIVERKLFTHEEAYSVLKSTLYEYRLHAYQNRLRLLEDLNTQKRILQKRIRNLERFNEEYELYKQNLKEDYDSLLPINYLERNIEEIIPTTEVGFFIDSLKTALNEIKAEISNKKSFSVNTKADIKQLQGELAVLDRKISVLPVKIKEFDSEAQKLMFIGELKAKLQFYEDKWNILETLPDENELKEHIRILDQQLKDTLEARRIILKLLEETIQWYYDETKSLGVYQKYKVVVDVSGKTLKLRKPDEYVPQNVIGSKSNHMFLHLCLFLGLHDYFLRKNPKYVPQYLIIDQISQPYLEKVKEDQDTAEKDDDRKTIQDAFKLLDTFMTKTIEENKNEFQIILFEHASKDYWETPLLKSFHLVEEFRNGNALIPERFITQK